MKYYIQYKQTITKGWNNFQKRLTPCKPWQADMCGSSSVESLDGRWNLDSMKNKAFEVWKQHENKGTITGFEIVKSDEYTNDKSKIIYTYKK